MEQVIGMRQTKAATTILDIVESICAADTLDILDRAEEIARSNGDNRVRSVYIRQALKEITGYDIEQLLTLQEQ